MAKLVVLYKTPKDPEAFNSYYAATHIPIARKIPGRRGYDVSRGVVATPAGPSEVHLVATLHFDDVAAIQAAFASPEGWKELAATERGLSGSVRPTAKVAIKGSELTPTWTSS